MSSDFAGKGKVAVRKTAPESVLSDVGEVMQLGEHREALTSGRATILMINTSWITWYPGYSSTPWQIEGVIRLLQSEGHERLIAGMTDGNAFDPYAAERNNKHKYVVDKYGVENVHLSEPHVEWVIYEPKAEMLVLHDFFPEGIQIPRMFIGKNIIHLPTLKSSTSTTIAGAIENVSRGLLKNRQPLRTQRAHHALIDLLAMQCEIHPGSFAVMDGTFAGGLSGLNGDDPSEADILLASADHVALDAISARFQGFDPMEIDFIRMAHERGLGVGDPKEIEIVGHDISLEDAWKVASTSSTTSASRRSVESESAAPSRKPVEASPLDDWSEIPSNVYYGAFWFPIVGRPRAKSALDSTKWGRLFKSYDDGRAVLPAPEPKSTAIAVAVALVLIALIALIMSRSSRR